MATKDITDIQVILAFIKSNNPNNKDKYPYNFLMEETGQCEKVCYRAMERAENKRYIDCGVSLRTGWVTPEGFDYLNKELHQYLTDGIITLEEFLEKTNIKNL